MSARRTVAALGLALLLAGSAAVAAPPAGPYPTGRLTVAGAAVAPAQILDARALPDASGRPSLMVTLTPAAVVALRTAAGGAATIAVTLDGKPIGESPAAALADGGTLLLSGDYGGYEAAAALARRISGRDPAPETEGDE